MKKIITLLSFCLIFLCVSRSVQAVAFSSSLSPSVQHVLVKPNSSGTVSYVLRNSGDPVTMRVFLKQVKVENDHVSLTPLNENIVTFADPALNQPFILTANQTKTVDFTVTTDENTTETDHYFAVVAEVVPEPADEGKTTVQLPPSITSFLLVTVKSDANLELNPHIALFKTKPFFNLSFFGKSLSIFDIGQPISAVLTVQNQGANAFQAQGWISLLGGGSNETFPLSPRYLMSGAQVTMSSELNTYCIQKQNAQKTICRSGNSVVMAAQRPGVYRLQASITAGEQGKGTLAETSFVVIPVKIIFAVLIICFSIPLGLLLYIKRKQK